MPTSIPEQAHQAMTKQLHSFRKIGSNAFNVFGFGLVVFDMFSDNPHSLCMMFENRAVGKLYFDQESGNYFNIVSKKLNKDKSGDIISADLEINVYSNYSFDKSSNKYIGIGNKKTITTTVYYGDDAKKKYLDIINGGPI